MCLLFLKLVVIIYFKFFFFEKNVIVRVFFLCLNDIIDILYRVNSLIIREYDRGYLV